MKKKEVVIAGIIGWIAGPFTFVYLETKSPIRALIELLVILGLGFAVSFWILPLFVFGYALSGAIGARNYNIRHASHGDGSADSLETGE